MTSTIKKITEKSTLKIQRLICRHSTQLEKMCTEIFCAHVTCVLMLICAVPPHWSIPGKWPQKQSREVSVSGRYDYWLLFYKKCAQY